MTKKERIKEEHRGMKWDIINRLVDELVPHKISISVLPLVADGKDEKIMFRKMVDMFRDIHNKLLKLRDDHEMYEDE